MQLLTKKEVANRCKMPVKWVEKAVSYRKIPSPIYLDGHVRWRENDIDEWIQSGCLPIPKIEKKQVDVQRYKENLNLKQIEKAAIIRALDVSKGNRENAALLLGIGERTVYRKISEYGLE
jgi:predicted DNA-binding transcriptional regulator AlpA